MILPRWLLTALGSLALISAGFIAGARTEDALADRRPVPVPETIAAFARACARAGGTLTHPSRDEILCAAGPAKRTQ